MVVFPDPEGAEKTINFPFFILKSSRETQSHPLFYIETSLIYFPFGG
jgi:hypothetical protein